MWYCISVYISECAVGVENVTHMVFWAFVRHTHTHTHTHTGLQAPAGFHLSGRRTTRLSGFCGELARNPGRKRGRISQSAFAPSCLSSSLTAGKCVCSLSPNERVYFTLIYFWRYRLWIVPALTSQRLKAYKTYRAPTTNFISRAI